MKYEFIYAVIRNNDFINTGYIHIDKELIEGYFSLDYVRFSFVGTHLVLLLQEFDTYENAFYEPMEYVSIKSGIDLLAKSTNIDFKSSKDDVISLKIHNYVSNKSKISYLKSLFSETNNKL